MIQINTLNDIGMTENLSKDFKEHLKGYFIELNQNIDKETSKEEFSLEDYGPIIILEPEKDDCRNLSDVGLNEDEEGILGVMPEYVNEVDLNKNEGYFQFLVLCNNEYGNIFYFPKHYKDDAEITDFLKSHIVS